MAAPGSARTPPRLHEGEGGGERGGERDLSLERGGDEAKNGESMLCKRGWRLWHACVRRARVRRAGHTARNGQSAAARGPRLGAEVHTTAAAMVAEGGMADVRGELSSACDALVRLAGALRAHARTRADASGRCVGAAADAARRAAEALAPWEATLAALPRIDDAGAAGAGEPAIAAALNAELSCGASGLGEDSDDRAFREAEAEAAAERTPEGGAAAALAAALSGLMAKGGDEATSEGAGDDEKRRRRESSASDVSRGSSACFDAPTPTLSQLATPTTVARLERDASVAAADGGFGSDLKLPRSGSVDSDALFRSPLGTPLAARMASPPTTCKRLRPADVEASSPLPATPTLPSPPRTCEALRVASKADRAVHFEEDKENSTVELRAAILGSSAGL